MSPGELTFETDLDGSAALSSLDAAQAMVLCEDTRAVAEALLTDERIGLLACLLVAVPLSLTPDGTVDVAACEDSLATCMSGGVQTTVSDTCDRDLPAELAVCDATVDDYGRCLNAQVMQTLALFDTLQCSTFDPGAALDPSNDLASLDALSECDAIVRLCPNFQGFGQSMGSLMPPPSASGCDDTCSDARDGFCDDGGPGSNFSFCGLGTDCTDCGPR